ncbi:DUF6049 family protein [Streptomyces sp. MNU89]|uniref:DUF6049 family protein n=1 Tax=Streptomyces sp. MNU89 TaxID=2560025 RepID=UPI001E4FF908|nr:DUF6049 family protein [Streptomyces sp. MNU89]MCC9740461.1 DUF6049 family protein [Streptomyces sp. MNU89]
MAEVAAIQGTTIGPARRWWRKAAAVLAGTPLLAGLVQLPAAPGAEAAASATGSRTVDVSINSLTPVVPAEDDTITVTGRVSNDGKSAVDGARVGLRVGQTPLSSRGAIGIVAKRKGFSAAEDGRTVDGEHTVKLGELPAGASRKFSMTLPAEDLNLGDAGVYQLGVALSGRTAGQYDQVLGIERTFLPWQPGEARKPTKIGYLWPLISTPHLTARTGSDQQQTPQFRDDSLAAELAPGGRLQQLVALGKDLPVTWVVDPDLLVSVEMMTKEYEIREPDGSVTKGEGQAVARQWMSDLLAAVEGRELVTLPFADPDLASLAHRGTKVSGSISHLKTATDLAVKTGETIFGRKPRADFAWPVNGAVDTSVIDVATSAGARNVITRGDSLRGEDEPPYTTSAVRPIGGGTTALAADTRLSTAFQGDMTGAENSTLAVQEFLAHTLMVNREAPGRERSLVVAPQRRPTAHQARAMAEALEGLRAGGWTQPQELRDAIQEKPDPRAATRVPGVRSYPEALRKQELPTRAFEDVQRTQNALNGFTVILSEPDRVITPFGNAILREMSTAWRGEPRAAEAYRESVEDYLAGLTQEVKLIEKAQKKLTLSGRSGTIPVTVQNNLLQGVEDLKLVLRSSSPHRLDPGEPQSVEIGSGHSQTVKFDTTANANGLVWVEAQLYTEDGRPYGAPMSFKVNVTEITSTVMLVIAGGVLLLVLAGIRMYTQRKRAAAREAGGPAGGAGTAEDEPQPAGTTGNAGAENAGGPEEAEGTGQDVPADPPPAGGDDTAGSEAPGKRETGGAEAGPEKSEAPDPGERVER